MATKIPVDGETEEFKMPENPKLEWFQKLVGGYVEFVNFPDGSAIMVHEEGRLIGLHPNFKATSLCMLKGRPQPDAYPIVGIAIFFSREEMEEMEKESPEEDHTGKRHNDPIDIYGRVSDPTDVDN